MLYGAAVLSFVIIALMVKNKRTWAVLNPASACNDYSLAAQWSFFTSRVRSGIHTGVEEYDDNRRTDLQTEPTLPYPSI